MESEREYPRPLESEEIKVGIAQKIADAVYDKLSTTCNLYGRAYPKFKATVSVRLELDDFGQTTFDNSITNVEGGEGEIREGSVPVDINLEIPQMPPNQFRQETDQPIIKTAVEDGKTVEKRIKYKPRTKVPKKTDKKGK